ncbi:TatD family hydrolase [Candidatus Woesearchaeota archaeon]|nr:TatD family hydrolase [Candidatus Woesearchaeota archaeon]
MKLVDVHCHLEHPLFAKDVDEVVIEAEKAGVAVIVTNGSNPDANRAALGIAEKHEIVKAALGIYPLDAFPDPDYAKTNKLKSFDIEKELEFIKENNEKIIGIGEVGLDFKYSDRKNEQIELFVDFIELSKVLRKPIIVHSRSAAQQVIESLESAGAKRVVLHNFEAKLKLVKRGVECGYMFSVPPLVLRSSHLQSLVSQVPSEQLLTETDAPFLGAFKEQRSEPSQVAVAVRAIAKLKGVQQAQAAGIIFDNFNMVFTS